MPDAAPVTTAICARQLGRLAGPLQLRLLERPVLHVEEVGGGQRAIATEMILGPLEYGDGVVVDVGRDLRVLHRATDREHPELGIEDDPRCRIEVDQLGTGPIPVGVDVRAVVRDEAIDVATDERYAFGSDHMIGRQRASSRQILQVGSLHEPARPPRRRGVA